MKETKLDPDLLMRGQKEPLAAIRLKCLDCMCDAVTEIRLCPIKACPLWRFRFGTQPVSHISKRTIKEKKESEKQLNYGNPIRNIQDISGFEIHEINRKKSAKK